MPINLSRSVNAPSLWRGWVLSVALCAAPVGYALAKDPASSSKPVVAVSEAWVRATVAGQQATGGFMDLTAAQSTALVGFETKVAAQSELHEMAMEGDVMRMRAIESLPLPAGQTVSLKPGAHHLMLMGLKKPLTVGQNLDLTLLLKGEDGKVTKQTIKVPVKAQSPMMGGGGGGMHHHHHHH